MKMPVESAFPQLIEALHSHNRVLLTAPPGSGKTTKVPLLLMEELPGSILMLEPRRLAARSSARFMAASLGEETGQSVGYSVRLERKVSRKTRVEIITEGILTKRLIANPELPGVSCVIFDEFHERSLQADTALAFCLEVQEALRPDLKILIMSATMAAEETARLLAPCPVVQAEGRTWPVDIRYLPCPPCADGPFSSSGKEALLSHAASAAKKFLAEASGSMLIFLPGQGEIRRLSSLLGTLPPDVSLHPLYGDLSAAEQDAAIAPPSEGHRKIVLATSIAETSLTIEGIRIVIDCGLTRNARFSPSTGMSALVTSRVTQDCASQRAGRAGRLEPGLCIRLWHKGDTLLPARRPEILDADLAPFLLDCLAWGSHPHHLPLLTPAPEASLAQAFSTLKSLGAIQESSVRPHLSPHGKELSRIPLHPRLAHMTVCAGEHLPLAAALSAITEERIGSSESCDIRTLLPELRTSARLRRAAEQIYALLSPHERLPLHAVFTDEEYCGPLLSLAWPERMAQRRERGKFRMASGRGAEMPVEEELADSPFLSIASLDGGTQGTARIYQAAPLSKNDILSLHKNGIGSHDIVLWDDRSESILAQRQITCGHLILEEKNLPCDAIPEEAVLHALCMAIAKLSLSCLPWTKALKQWQSRVLLMKRMHPEENWPDISDQELLNQLKKSPHHNWLSPWLTGVTRKSHFSSIPLEKALHALLPYPLSAALEKEAPAGIYVPSGSFIAIDYLPEGGPVLAVKLQEMFGMQNTPSLCGGKCPLTVHLLSPAGRPLQVTRDLAGFWKTGYASVRAEMRGRYPRHPWPEDPLTALPTKKTNKALRK